MSERIPSNHKRQKVVLVKKAASKYTASAGVFSTTVCYLGTVAWARHITKMIQTPFRQYFDVP